MFANQLSSNDLFSSNPGQMLSQKLIDDASENSSVLWGSQHVNSQDAFTQPSSASQVANDSPDMKKYYLRYTSKAIFGKENNTGQMSKSFQEQMLLTRAFMKEKDEREMLQFMLKTFKDTMAQFQDSLKDSLNSSEKIYKEGEEKLDSCLNQMKLAIMDHIDKVIKLSTEKDHINENFKIIEKQLFEKQTETRLLKIQIDKLEKQQYKPVIEELKRILEECFAKKEAIYQELRNTDKKFFENQILQFQLEVQETQNFVKEFPQLIKKSIDDQEKQFQYLGNILSKLMDDRRNQQMLEESFQIQIDKKIEKCLEKDFLISHIQKQIEELLHNQKILSEQFVNCLSKQNEINKTLSTSCLSKQNETNKYEYDKSNICQSELSVQPIQSIVDNLSDQEKSICHNILVKNISQNVTCSNYLAPHPYKSVHSNENFEDNFKEPPSQAVLGSQRTRRKQLPVSGSSKSYMPSSRWKNTAMKPSPIATVLPIRRKTNNKMNEKDSNKIILQETKCKQNSNGENIIIKQVAMKRNNKLKNCVQQSKRFNTKDNRSNLNIVPVKKKNKKLNTRSKNSAKKCLKKPKKENLNLLKKKINKPTFSKFKNNEIDHQEQSKVKRQLLASPGSVASSAISPTLSICEIFMQRKIKTRNKLLQVEKKTFKKETVVSRPSNDFIGNEILKLKECEASSRHAVLQKRKSKCISSSGLSIWSLSSSLLSTIK